MAMEYRCCRCDCGFETQEEQLQHMDDYRHEECFFCNDSFGEGRDVVKHEALEHDRCEVCQKDFGDSNELRQVRCPSTFPCASSGERYPFNVPLGQTNFSQALPRSQTPQLQMFRLWGKKDV